MLKVQSYMQHHCKKEHWLFLLKNSISPPLSLSPSFWWLMIPDVTFQTGLETWLPERKVFQSNFQYPTPTIWKRVFISLLSFWPSCFWDLEFLQSNVPEESVMYYAVLWRHKKRKMLESQVIKWYSIAFHGITLQFFFYFTCGTQVLEWVFKFCSTF